MASPVNKYKVMAEKFLIMAKPHWEEFLKYAKVELVPPKPSEFKEIRKEVNCILQGARKGNYKQTTVRDAWLNALITMEVGLWFFVGEVIGRRHFVGYKV